MQIKKFSEATRVQDINNRCTKEYKKGETAKCRSSVFVGCAKCHMAMNYYFHGFSLHTLQPVSGKCPLTP